MMQMQSGRRPLSLHLGEVDIGSGGGEAKRDWAQTDEGAQEALRQVRLVIRQKGQDRLREMEHYSEEGR